MHDGSNREYYEQQLEILKSAAMNMAEFPADLFAEYGVALGWETWIMRADNILDGAGEMLAPIVALRLASSRYGENATTPYLFRYPSNTGWRELIELAHEWFMEHMSAETALGLFQELTGSNARLNLPDQLNLKLAVHYGLKAGFIKEISLIQPAGIAHNTSNPIAIKTSVGLCQTHFSTMEIVGEDVVLTNFKSLAQCNEWLPMFELMTYWWSKRGPILP